MVVRPHLHWFRMLLAWRGSVLPQLLPRLFLIFCISLVAVAVHVHWLPITVNLSTTPFSLVGIALAVFLGFRNNASYDRYWEARKLWGQLLNDSRSLTRQALTLPRGDASNGGVAQADVREFAQVLGALPHALRHQLRHTDARADLAARLPAPLLERVMAARYRPIAIVLWLGEWVQRHTRPNSQSGALDPYAALAFDRNLNALSNLIGGCERIASTPLPFAYSVMIHRTVYFFCATLPFGLVESIGNFTPVFAVFVAYTFMAHEAIASQLEDPFGMEDNDLALNAMSAMIEDAVRDIMGEPSLAGAKGAQDFILD
jgi:putative membrane protein